MSESLVWEACWRRLDSVFAGVARQLLGRNPALWFQSGRRTSDRCPFDAWAEFGRVRDPARTEDIVVFVAVARHGDAWCATVDISTGEGVVLANGPTRNLAMDSSRAMQSEMLLYVADVQRFLADHESLLRKALC